MKERETAHNHTRGSGYVHPWARLWYAASFFTHSSKLQEITVHHLLPQTLMYAHIPNWEIQMRKSCINLSRDDLIQVVCFLILVHNSRTLLQSRLHLKSKTSLSIHRISSWKLSSKNQVKPGMYLQSQHTVLRTSSPKVSDVSLADIKWSYFPILYDQ